MILQIENFRILDSDKNLKDLLIPPIPVDNRTQPLHHRLFLRRHRFQIVEQLSFKFEPILTVPNASSVLLLDAGLSALSWGPADLQIQTLLLIYQFCRLASLKEIITCLNTLHHHVLLAINRERDLMRLTLKRLLIQMHFRTCHVLRIALQLALRAKVRLTRIESKK